MVYDQWSRVIQRIIVIAAFLFLATGCAKQPAHTAVAKESSLVKHDVVTDKNMGSEGTMVVEKQQVVEVTAAPEKPVEAEKPVVTGKMGEIGRKIGLKDLHVVKNGESLWWIAKYKDIYNDPYLWPVIYMANNNLIKHPHIIYPGQILKIPRTGFDMEAIKQHRKKAGAPQPYTPQRSANPPLH